MRNRLILSFILIALISITIVVLIARASAVNEVRSFMYRGSITESTDFIESLETYYQDNNTWEGSESLITHSGRMRGSGQGRSENSGGQRLMLVNVDGQIVADSSDTSTGEHLDKSELNTAIKLKNGFRTVGYLIAESGMGFTSESGQQLIERLNTAALIAAIIAGVLSLILALVLSYTILRPIRELTEAAGLLGEGDLSQRVPIHGKDELAVLGRKFNQMADSLESEKESRRAMTADIAHELRNPLAVQRASLEAMQDGIYPITSDNLQPAIEQNLLLSRMVDDLRTLALADSGQLKLNLTDVNISKLAEIILNRFQAKADEKKISFKLQTKAYVDENDCLIYADPMRIEQILTNLLSNAIQHTPHKGRIGVEIKRGVKQVNIMISDNGPGIPEDSIPLIFERFYRADRARSRMDGGTGLGLAIARQLAETHGGTLTASNHPNGGAVFTLSMPCKNNSNNYSHHEKE